MVVVVVVVVVVVSCRTHGMHDGIDRGIGITVRTPQHVLFETHLRSTPMYEGPQKHVRMYEMIFVLFKVQKERDRREQVQ